MSATLIKNLDSAKRYNIVDLVQYSQGQVVSRTLAQGKAHTITLFAFDAGEGLSTHTAPGDALVQILDGEAAITIGDVELVLKAGEVTVMPADIPHAVHAERRFKMMLILVKKPRE